MFYIFLQLNQAMLVLKLETCLEFVPKKATDVDYVHIIRDAILGSPIGRTGGEQELVLGNIVRQKRTCYNILCFEPLN